MASISFRKLAQKWHPDNFQDEEEKKKAEKKFMDIAAAKEVLTDEGMSLMRIPVLLYRGKKTLIRKEKLLIKLGYFQKCAKSMTMERIHSTQNRRTAATEVPSPSKVTRSAAVEGHFSSSFTSTEERLFQDVFVNPRFLCLPLLLAEAKVVCIKSCVRLNL